MAEYKLVQNSAEKSNDASTRALQEAEKRRREKIPDEQPPEVGGRGGLDPTRYGDWENKGIVSDF